MTSRTERNCSVAGMDIRQVAVIGLGTMGAGIAEVFARGGLAVTGIEVSQEALAAGRANLDRSLARAARSGKVDEAGRQRILDRVTLGTAFGDASTADLVVEAVPERMDLKRRVFAELDRLCGPDTILATNTSSLSVTEIAAGTSRPSRVLGIHFFNPAPVMRLVEVVTTVLTEPGVRDATTSLVRGLGKTVVTVSDRAGFVVNALLLPYLNHAAALLGTGYATREDIDAAAKTGMGLPMGPLTLLDLIGLDTSLSILEALQAEFGGQRYAPAPLLRRLVTAGMTGRKSGRGFYGYGPAGPRVAVSPDLPNGSADVPPPRAVALVPWDATGEESAAALATEIGAAGIGVTVLPPDNAARCDLLLVAAAPHRPVLPDALATGRPADVVGLHLVGKGLAEVVRTAVSSAAVADRAAALAAALGRAVVRCPDRPGLLVGALLYPHLNDAVRMLGEGYASAADIDAAMTAGCGYPRGPLQMIDDIGPAAVFAGLAAMHERWRDPAVAPAPLLADHALAGLPFRPVA